MKTSKTIVTVETTQTIATDVLTGVVGGKDDCANNPNRWLDWSTNPATGWVCTPGKNVPWTGSAN